MISYVINNEINIIQNFLVWSAKKREKYLHFFCIVKRKRLSRRPLFTLDRVWICEMI